MRPTVYSNCPRDSYAARLLRALFSAIVPGVGQLVAGVRRRGFVLLGIFLLVSLAGVIILTRGTDAILAWVVQPKVLLVLLCVNIVIMLVRMFAVIDAWRTAKVRHPQVGASLRPRRAPDRRRVGSGPRADRRSSRCGRLLHHRFSQPPHLGLRRRRREQHHHLDDDHNFDDDHDHGRVHEPVRGLSGNHSRKFFDVGNHC